MFSAHTTPKKFENATITGHFGFILRKTPAGKSHGLIIVHHRFRKAHFSE